jgi:hypothetical protein
MRRNRIGRLLRLAAMFAGVTMRPGAAEAGDVVGWMDVRPANGKIEIAGRAYSGAPVTVDYTLTVERAGPSGRSATSQRGRADLTPGETTRLSTTSVSFSAKDELTVVLTLTGGGRTLATSEIHLGD